MKWIAVILLWASPAFALYDLHLMEKINNTTIRVTLKDGNRIGVPRLMKRDDVIAIGDSAKAVRDEFLALWNGDRSSYTDEEIEHWRQMIAVAREDYELFVRLKLTGLQVIQTGTSATTWVNP